MSSDLASPSEIELRKFLDDLPNLPIFVRGKIPAEEQLPSVAEYHRYDALHWRGHLWVKRLNTSESWTDAGKVRVLTPQYPAKPPEIDTDSLVLPEESAPHELVPSITFKGSWPHDDELPNPETAETWDAWMYKGRCWVKRPEGHWDPLPEFATHPFTTFVSTEAQQNQYAYDLLLKYIADEEITVKGRWVEPVLPNPKHFKEREALWKDNGDLWVHKHEKWCYLFMPREVFETLGKGDLTSADLDPVPVADPVREDKGALARELMEQKAEVKRLRRARIKYLCFLWLIILLIVAGFGTAAYAYVQRDLVIGRYSDSRDCSLKVGNVTITGKRTYSYPAYSLWGQRWVQESNVQEVTTINLPGSRLDILMDAEPKWIGYRFSDGERGTQILKPALKYAFVMDKGMAMATYGGFCQPLDKQQVPDDPKNQERPIIN